MNEIDVRSLILNEPEKEEKNEVEAKKVVRSECQLLGTEVPSL